ncbi:MAG: sigma-54 dependent transcriptional regulator [Pseudomonadota bacterium]
MNRILIVDDDPELRHSLRAAFVDLYQVDEAEDGKSAVEWVDKYGSPNLVILDMDMPRMGGMEALRQIKRKDPRIIILILTAYSTVPDAVAAIREGAYNYLSKPIRHDDIRHMVDRALKAHEMVAQVAYSAPIFKGEIGIRLSSQSDEMRKIVSLIEKVATVDTAILFRGESGTGKEVLAQAIHYNSLRKDGKFVAVNCSAIPENLIESELFGHEKGSFTGADQRKIGKFQYAEGGTLFLDEIGDISPAMQVKLLRVLQEKVFSPVGSNLEVQTNVRIMAATNRNLEDLMAKGIFREDLYYRLNVLPIFLPPLRDRKEDIEILIQHFIRKFNAAHKKTIQGIDTSALARMKEYQWPGNIRELGNVIEHAFIMESGTVVTELALPERLRPVDVARPAASQAETSSPAAPSAEPHAEGELDFQVYKEKLEKEFIVRALQKFNGRINLTSAQTNIPKKTLLRKIEKYKIKTEDFRK